MAPYSTAWFILDQSSGPVPLNRPGLNFEIPGRPGFLLARAIIALKLIALKLPAGSTFTGCATAGKRPSGQALAGGMTPCAMALSIPGLD